MTVEQKKIILVDDNDANLTACKKILKPYYLVYPVPSAEKMFDLLEHVTPDLILLDVEMPDINGYEAARTLKNTEAYKKFPIIFLTAKDDAISEMEGLNLGALDYIRKPFFSALLLRRLEMHLSLIDYQKLLETRNQSKDILFSKLGSEINVSLNAGIEMLKTASETDDAGIIKDYIDKVDNLLKSLLVLVNKTTI